nr:uncharacterized protein LOC119622308 [Chlorocebus sabaeus]
MWATGQDGFEFMKNMPSFLHVPSKCARIINIQGKQRPSGLIPTLWRGTPGTLWRACHFTSAGLPWLLPSHPHKTASQAKRTKKGLSLDLSLTRKKRYQGLHWSHWQGLNHMPIKIHTPGQGSPSLGQNWSWGSRKEKGVTQRQMLTTGTHSLFPCSSEGHKEKPHHFRELWCHYISIIKGHFPFASLLIGNKMCLGAFFLNVYRSISHLPTQHLGSCIHSQVSGWQMGLTEWGMGLRSVTQPHPLNGNRSMLPSLPLPWGLRQGACTWLSDAVRGEGKDFHLLLYVFCFCL